MTPSIWQLLIVLAIVLLLFGRGKIPQLMGDMAKGIKSFKRGLTDEDKKDDIENKSNLEVVYHNTVEQGRWCSDQRLNQVTVDDKYEFDNEEIDDTSSVS